jgi:hypothetical protein
MVKDVEMSYTSFPVMADPALTNWKGQIEEKKKQKKA